MASSFRLLPISSRK